MVHFAFNPLYRRTARARGLGWCGVRPPTVPATLPSRLDQSWSHILKDTIIGLRKGTCPRPGKQLPGLTRTGGDRVALSSLGIQVRPSTPVRVKLIQQNSFQLV